jgi:hypothetical protein
VVLDHSAGAGVLRGAADALSNHPLTPIHGVAR